MLQSPFERAGASLMIRRSFVVVQNARAQRVARDHSGSIEGVFQTQREAIRFALFETGSRSAAVVVDDAVALQQH